MSEVPKLSRSERLRLIAFRNVQERKLKNDMSKEEKRNKIELYSLKQAEYLKEYYSDIVIGKPFGINHKIVINQLRITEHKKDKCELQGIGYLVNDDSIIILAGIKTISENLDLESPEKVLLGLS